MMSGDLTYRVFRDDDLPGVLRLWAEDSGWGALTAETWRQWYVDTPYGSALTLVALDEAGEVVAQEVLMPARLAVGDREVPALRLSAPILRRGLRQGTLFDGDHPALALYARARAVAADRGYAVVYMLPERSWLPVLRALPRLLPTVPALAVAEYPCVAAPLAESGRAAASRDGLRAYRVREFGAEYQTLWEAARRDFPITCGVARHPERLRFRHASNIVLEVQSARGTLVGFAVVKVRGALLQDVLARAPDELADVIAVALRWLASERSEFAETRPRQLIAMDMPVLRPALRAAGFEPLDHHFAFACGTLDVAIPATAIAPDTWYLTPGD
jgi:hypothetical protein